MAAVDDIWRVLESLISGNTKSAMVNLGFDFPDRLSFPGSLTSLHLHLPPSYLPFSSYNGSPLAFHLLPDRPLADSPVIYLDVGSRSPQFMCDRLANLPTAVWLWVAAFFKDDQNALRRECALLASDIPSARPIPDDLWDILEAAGDFEPSWWNHRAQKPTQDAWLAADVGHPFALLTDLDGENPVLAIKQLTAAMNFACQPNPHVLATLMTARQKIGETVEDKSVISILSSEAWLGGEEIFYTDWHYDDSGLSLWSIALRGSTQQMLSITPFDPLWGHPDTYSGQDPQGPQLLEQVAANMCIAADNKGQLIQLRNSAFVSLYARGGYGAALCNKIAETCDMIAVNSTAASLARAIAELSQTTELS